jgi:hypothetical protein
MIASKPKTSTAFSVGVFLLLSYGLLIYTLRGFIISDQPAIYQYIILLIISPIAIFVSFKFIKGLKYISIQKSQMEVRSFFGLIKKKYHLNELEKWEETIIKTTNGTFKELKFIFIPNAKVTVSNQEQTNYDKLFSYISKNYKNKKA